MQGTPSAVVVAMLLGACASGGETGPLDADVVRLDAPRDAAPIDMQQVFDGPTDTLPMDMQIAADAPPGSNLFCTTNADCTVAGECCFDFFGESPQGFCVTNISPIPGTCVPEL